MKNFNAEQIIKALECFHQRILNTNLAEKITEGEMMAIIDAFALINELTEQVKKDNKTIIDLYHECETYLAQRDCFRNQVKNLTEENERLRADVAKEFTCVFGQPHRVGDCPIDDEIAKAKADTVRKMQERLKEAFEHRGLYGVDAIERRIDQIAKEMLEGENEDLHR